MGEAVLRIRTEGGADVAKLLADVERLAASSQKAIEQGARVSRQRQSREARASQQQEVAGYRQSAQTIQREDQLVTRSKLRELALRDEARKRFQERYAEAEKQATQLLEGEIGKRGELTGRERRQVETLALAIVNEHDRAERARTTSTKREARAREAVERATAQKITAGIRQAAAIAAQAADAAHALIQSNREDLATADRTLGNAIRNSGGSDADVADARSAVARFVSDTGMRYEDVTAALETGQARGSALEARPGETRAQALAGALETVRDANAEAANPGQLLAARGRLSQAGLTGDALNQAVRYTLRAAQRGSVEVDQIITQGLPGAASLMTQRAAALGPNASPAARTAARLQAYQESVALQEVAASTGRQPGNSANNLANLNNFLRTPRRQEMILQNIRTAESQLNTATPEGRAQADRLRALREGMFERDPTRTGNAMRMREGISPLEFAARLTHASGGDASRAFNLLAGTGTGNAQSLLANQRSLLTFLGSEGGRVVEMMRGGGVTDAEMAAHRTAVEGDDLARINRSREQGRQAAREPGAARRASDLIADRERMHPLFYSAVRSVPVAGPLAIAGMGALYGAFGSDTPSDGATSVPVTGRSPMRPASATSAPPAQTEAIRDAVRDGVVAGLRNAQITAEVSQHDAEHAANVARSRAGGMQ